MDRGYDDDEDDVVVDAAEAEEASLRELESRLGKLKEPSGGASKTYAKGVSLVTSMGFVLAGCTVGGLYLGDYLAKKFAMPSLQVAGLVLGLAAALFAVVKLMGPFLRSPE